MKKPIIFSVLFFIITSISSFGQWVTSIELDSELRKLRQRLEIEIQTNKSDIDIGKPVTSGLPCMVTDPRPVVIA